MLILNAPTPTNVNELKACFVKLNYYHRFLDRQSTTLEPLYKLIRKVQSWLWSNTQQEVFEKAKHLLTSTQLIVHYDLVNPLVKSWDASHYGVAAVLSHQIPNGGDRPTLTSAERNYCHLEKETLSILYVS